MDVDRGTKETALAIMEELKGRRSNDPLLTYELHPKQKPFVNSSIKGVSMENWFLAANRSGKSDAGAYIGATLARFGAQEPWGISMGKAPPGKDAIVVKDRSTSGWVSALDFPTCRDTIEPKYFDNGMGLVNPKQPPFIPKHEIAEWRATDRILKLKNGSIIGFKSADSGRKKYQGAEKDWVHLDEEHPYDIYEEVSIRVGSRPLRIFCTATILPPDGMAMTGPSWVFGRIIQPWQQGQLPYVGLFGASIYDNPHIPLEEIKRLEAMHPEGSTSRRIRMLGEWLPGLGGSRAYPGFDRQLHVREQPAIVTRRPLLWCWDFNVEPMVSLVGQFDGLIYRIYRELILQSASISDMCDLFYTKFPSHEAEIWVYGDASGNKRTGQTGRSDYFLMLQEMKSYGVPIRLKVPEDNPRGPDRINALNVMLRDQDGQVRIQVDPSCHELIRDMEEVMRDPKGGVMKTYNRRDPYFWRSHTSDALGYMIAYEEPVRPPSSARPGQNIAPPPPNYGFNYHKG